MELQAWHIAVISGVLSFVGSYTAMKATFGERIRQLTEAVRKIEDPVNGLPAKATRRDIARIHERLDSCQLKTDSATCRKEQRESNSEIKAAVLRLENKFDEYVASGSVRNG